MRSRSAFLRTNTGKQMLENDYNVIGVETRPVLARWSFVDGRAGSRSSSTPNNRPNNGLNRNDHIPVCVSCRRVSLRPPNARLDPSPPAS